LFNDATFAKLVELCDDDIDDDDDDDGSVIPPEPVPEAPVPPTALLAPLVFAEPEVLRL